MRKKDYKTPIVFVHCIKPEELMQPGGISDTPIGGGDADAKYNDFDDERADVSGGVWED